MIVLSNIRTEKRNGQRLLVCDIEHNVCQWQERTMWFSVPEQCGDMLADGAYDSFLVALLFPAMVLGEDVTVAGDVSKRLLFSIQNYVKPFIKMYCQQSRDINVWARNMTERRNESAVHIGTGYSGGVDSLCTIYEHSEVEKTKGYSIDTLIFLNTGSHGQWSNPGTWSKFHARFDYLKKYAMLPFVPCDSNIHAFHEFLPNSHQKTVSFTNAAGILALGNYFRRYYVASSLSYAESVMFGMRRLNICTEAFDSILLPLLSTETVELIADGQQYTRSQKTERIAGWSLAQKSLNVCVNQRAEGARNCSCCSKCLRTLMALDSMDRLQEFSGVFDLDIYRRHRFSYRCRQRVLYRKDGFAKDNVDFARANGKRLPPYPLALLVSAPSLMLGRVARRVLGDRMYESLRKRIKGAGSADRAC